MSNVAIIDSGIGGISVYKHIKRVLPRHDYLYFCDNARFPYGEKSSDELIDTAFDIFKKITDLYDLSCAVLACNTLTAFAVDALRRAYPSLPIVGTEPAVKQALQYTAGRVAVACTSACAHSERIRKRFSAPNVEFLPFPLLACMIEEGASQKEMVKYVEEIAGANECCFDSVVLGCTHFLLVKEVFSQVFIKQKLFDGAMGVANRVKSLVGKKTGGGTTCIMLSKEDADKRQKLLTLIRQ